MCPKTSTSRSAKQKHSQSLDEGVFEDPWTASHGGVCEGVLVGSGYFIFESNSLHPHGPYPTLDLHSAIL